MSQMGFAVGTVAHLDASILYQFAGRGLLESAVHAVTPVHMLIERNCNNWYDHHSCCEPRSHRSTQAGE